MIDKLTGIRCADCGFENRKENKDCIRCGSEVYDLDNAYERNFVVNYVKIRRERRNVIEGLGHFSQTSIFTRWLLIALDDAGLQIRWIASSSSLGEGLVSRREGLLDFPWPRKSLGEHDL